jgi:geranylgeranyl pyrophosphate synthase
METTDPFSSILSNLGWRASAAQKGEDQSDDATREDACVKTCLKTASLIAKEGRAAVVLGGCKDGDIVKEIAYAYRRNFGIASRYDGLSFRRAVG